MGYLEVIAFGQFLTEGADLFVSRLRNGPLVSNYHCAEWLAWNWWRLRWEPRAPAPEWSMAHRMSSIGYGYAWPNITIISDGERVSLEAKPSSDEKSGSFRYITDCTSIVRAVEFEGAVDLYVNQVISQLRAEGIAQTNLDRIWTELAMERRDPALSRQRRLEAMLGSEPGEADEAKLISLTGDAAELGEAAALEIAADAAGAGHVRTARDFEDAASSVGFHSRPGDAARLTADALLPPMGAVAAWKWGALAAAQLRKQAGLELQPLSNEKLASLAGMAVRPLHDRKSRDAGMSFALDKGQASRVVFRSKVATGRRFELARLIGDRASLPPGLDRLHPSTRANTYRQQLQRAFAAELLCPLPAIIEQLKGDFSPESISEAAQAYDISELAVQTTLVNNGFIARDSLDDHFGHASAA